MVNKLKFLAGLLAVALVIAIGVSVYFGSQNLAFSDQTKSQGTKLEMISILTQAQVRAEAELQKLGVSLVYASEQLSTTGLEGDQARAVLSALAANSSFTIEAATQNLNRTMITVEPASLRSSEGKTIGPQKWLNINPNGPILPSMTAVIPLIVGYDGVSIVAPVFDLNKTLIGTLSVAFNHVALLNATVAPLIKDTKYAVTISQLDSKIIYDTDPAQQGKVLFDPIYANYTSLLAMWHHVASESSGYGTYTFTLNAESGQIVQKECFWTTIGAYGAEWRLAIIHALDA